MNLPGFPVIALAALFAAGALSLSAAGDGAVVPAALMPGVGDHTHMWWAEGFPGHTPSAPWRRCIQTGHYAMVLDTDVMRIPHMGPVSPGLAYAEVARADNSAWPGLPPADLALIITVEGRAYRCTRGGTWSAFAGPRLIESGRFLQRADVTDLVFAAEDGTRLNVEARFETVAWPDRLGLILAARPGLLPIPAGEACFGRVGGGFGLDGTNHFEIPHSPELDPERFALELWAFVPTDCQVSDRVFPWLVCKNRHEQADGNYGIVILGGMPQARMNIGGGRANEFSVDARPGQLKTEAWNHLVMSYDGDVMRFYVNGKLSGEQKIGRRRAPGRDGLAFGRRQDNCGDGYHFRGAIDEIRLYDQALTDDTVRARFEKPGAANPALKPVREWNFRADGRAAISKPGEQWREATMEISLTAPDGISRKRWELPEGQAWGPNDWREVFGVLGAREMRPSAAGVLGGFVRELGDKIPDEAKDAMAVQSVGVEAFEIPGGATRPVDHDAARGWHRVNLDGIEPILPPGDGRERRNDAVERVRLVLCNPAQREQVARLLFQKNATGFRQRIGAAITGISAILRDPAGHPTGIPVQLSKNWHSRPEGGVYSGMWFHGFSQVRLPPRATVELELTLAYGHWGGVAAASHAQLCLIGWGSNQLWDQSALGSWGESICYEPDQAQGQCAILDVRPVMVRSMSNDAPWSWTHNVGGGDFFRLFDPDGRRMFPGRVRTAYDRHGPCLTDVTYAGQTGGAIQHAATVSLARTDDVVRGTYRLRLDVKKEVRLSRFVIFQIGADTCSFTGERKMALGNETGLVREWETRWGGGAYRTEPVECAGRVRWISLHDAARRGDEEERGAWANRGIVIRSWDARLGGKRAAPWAAERGVNARGKDTSTIDLLPPPGVARLEPGDFVDATIEHIIMPQFAVDYYGPNRALRAALDKYGNTWRMIHREAIGNERRVEMKTGTLEGLHPAVRVRVEQDRAEFALAGGLGYVPMTFTGLASPRGYTLLQNGQPVDQSVHGNDFWQADYDPVSRTWQLTFNVPPGAGGTNAMEFARRP